MNTSISFFVAVYFRSLVNTGFLEDTKTSFFDKTDLPDPTWCENF